MRLYDLHHGQVTDVEPARRRLLRLRVAAPAAGDRAGLGDLRTFVTGDLIRRNAERHKLVVQAGQAAGGAADGAVLGQRPAEESDLDGVADVQVGGRPGGPRPALDSARRGAVRRARRPRGPGRRHRARAGPAGPAAGVPAAALPRASWTWTGPRWTAPTRPCGRGAGWSRSGPPTRAAAVGPHAAEVTGAFDNDLFAPGALVTLRALAASAQIPPGAKFETFAHLDQLLGLDLAREVGR